MCDIISVQLWARTRYEIQSNTASLGHSRSGLLFTVILIPYLLFYLIPILFYKYILVSPMFHEGETPDSDIYKDPSNGTDNWKM